MATKVSICSNALLMLGGQTINSLDEGTDRARLASNLYDSTRDDLLRSHPWNCAIKRVILAPETTPPAFDYGSQFLLPGDWLRNVSVGPRGYEVDFKLEGQMILADGDSLSLRYVFRNANEGTWDTLLVTAMELKLASLMAYGITQSGTMADLMHGKFKDHMKAARAVDGQDEPPQTFGDERLLNARFGSVRGR
ncbi:MAG: hypothetical protein V4451_16940 [Pseudomonadota bacterium]